MSNQDKVLLVLGGTSLTGFISYPVLMIKGMPEIGFICVCVGFVTMLAGQRIVKKQQKENDQ